MRLQMGNIIIQLMIPKSVAIFESKELHFCINRVIKTIQFGDIFLMDKTT